MKNFLLPVFSIGACIALLLAVSGCTSAPKSAAQTIFERCVQSTTQCTSVKVEGDYSASESSGHSAHRTYTGAERKINGTSLGEMVLSGRILNGQTENVTVYVTDGYTYFNTGTGWWKRKSGKLTGLAAYQPYLENYRLTSASGDTYTVAADFTSRAVKTWYGNAYGKDAKLTQTFTIDKKNYLLVESTRVLNAKVPPQWSFNMSAHARYFDYSAPLDLELPAEAVDARTAKPGSSLPEISGYSP